jgi:hypothetical protein
MTKWLCSLMVLGLVSAGCASDPVGNWQSREKLSNDKRNTLFIGADGVGELKMYAVLASGEALTKINADFDWVLEGAGEDGFDQYELDMDCDSGCREGIDLDFKMDCVLNTDFNLLDCEAKSPFQEYGFFEFEPAEEEG